MKRIFLIIIITASALFGFNNEKSKQTLTNSEKKLVEELRLKYYKAVEEEDSIAAYEDFVLENYSTISELSKALAVAYKAGIDAVKSKHAFWPLAKLNYLKKSLENLEKAVLIEPKNLETRFMRFSILHYVPGFLGYSAERDVDAKIILRELLEKNYNLVEKKIQKGIYEFIIESERLREKESEFLISQLKEQFANE
ncbi:MAG: hypothetical protein FD143_2814 [Ignavibacteria bacterium]|nr:MAG: hypothetical protein FD143_2814 [Ignavibacteria bacterium]KAF0155683.1 MAG: hypothetical protein FD188_3102 [Ignavibacteria bacterium]